MKEQDFEVFATKAVALGRTMTMKGGKESIKLLLSKNGAATRNDLIAATGMSRSDTYVVVRTLKEGGLLDVPEQYGSIMTLDTQAVEAAVKALSKPMETKAQLALKHGKMVAKFTKLPTKEDPIIEGYCGPYSFTAVMSEDKTKGVWKTGAEYFVMRDRTSEMLIAKHDPEQGWVKRPNNPSKIKHLLLIERLFQELCL